MALQHSIHICVEFFVYYLGYGKIFVHKRRIPLLKTLLFYPRSSRSAILPYILCTAYYISTLPSHLNFCSVQACCRLSQQIQSRQRHEGRISNSMRPLQEGVIAHHQNKGLCEMLLSWILFQGLSACRLEIA